MQILTGIDIVQVSRIEKILRKASADRFINKVYTAKEQLFLRETACSNKESARRAAGYFAAKEAASKALGTGVCRGGIGFLSFELAYDSLGKPSIEFRAAAAERAAELGIFSSSLSISHDGDYAVAQFTALARADYASKSVECCSAKSSKSLTANSSKSLTANSSKPPTTKSSGDPAKN